MENWPAAKLYLDRNLHVIFSITLMNLIGVSIIAPALPVMADKLKVDTESIGLLITAFALPGVFLSPVFGVLADRWGRKKVLAPSLILFGLSGGACALVQDFQLLLAMRFVQGVFVAALGPINLTLMGDLFSGRDRDAAMGLNASLASVVTSSYPAIGGALAGLAWNYPFLVQLVAVPVGLAVIFLLDNPEPQTGQGLVSYFKAAWSIIINPQVLALFAVIVFNSLIAFGAILNYFPLFMEEKFSANPVAIGLLMSTGSVAVALVSSQYAKLTGIFTHTALIKISLVLVVVTLVMVPLMGNYFLLVIPFAVYGVAMGVNNPSIAILLAEQAPLENRAAVMSASNMMLRLGQTLGPVVMGAAFALGGLEAVFNGGAILALFMLVFAFFSIRQVSGAELQ